MRRLALILLTLFCFAGIARAQGLPQPIVTVDFSVSEGAATYRASGFLHGMNSTTPGDPLVLPMNGKLWRGASMYVNDAGTYGRVIGLGGTPMFVLSDLWAAEHGGYGGGNTHPCDDGSGCTAWRAFVTSQVTADRGAGHYFQYDIWNEPDLTQYWNRSTAQYDEMWSAAVQVIKGFGLTGGHLPIPIVGPSTCCNMSFAASLFTYANANGVNPTIAAFHEFGGPGALASDVGAMRGYASPAGITLIDIPEMVDVSSNLLPGTNVQYLAAAERAQVNGAAHACWSAGFCSGVTGYSGALDGLVMTDGVTKTAAWYAYAGYGAVDGTLVSVTPATSGQTVDGVAGSNCGANHAYSVFGLAGGPSSPIIKFKNISVGASCLIVGGKVHAKIFTLADDGGAGSSGPISDFSTELDYTISADELDLSYPAIPGMGANDVLIIQLTPPASGGGGGGGGGTGPNVYYADYSSGSDSNPGTKASPWQHIPGMQGTSLGVGPGAIETGTGGGPGPAPGDSFILKGGVTWPAAAFPMVMVYTGLSSSTSSAGCAGSGCIYIGVDQTWYTGGSWTRPIFDGQDTLPAVDWGGAQAAVDLYGGYFVFDNIELPNWWQVGNTSTTWAIIAMRCTHCELKNNYIHAWGHSGTTGGVGGTFLDNGKLISGGNACPADMTSSIHDNVIDGFDSSQDAFQALSSGQGYVYNNYIAWTATEMLSSSRYIFNNSYGPTAPVFFEIGVHGNVLEATNCNLIVYNNYSLSGQGGATFFPSPITGSVDYWFNNLVVNTTNQAIQIDNGGIEATGGGSGSGIYVFNNTLQTRAGYPNNSIAASTGGPGHGDSTVMPFVYVANNHLIGDDPIVNFGPYIATPTQTNNIKETNAQATAAGYSSSPPYPFIPTGPGMPTSGAGLTGTAMAPICAGIPSDSLAQASTACLSDTTVGVGYNTSNHTVIVPNRASLTRPTGTGAWDASAYQPGGGSGGAGPLLATSGGEGAFGVQPVGSSPELFVDLTNIGTETLNISSISVTGTGFTQTSTTCGSTLAPLPATNTCLVGVTFAPVANVNYSGLVTFVTNASTSPNISPLTGSGGVPNQIESPVFAPPPGTYCLPQPVNFIIVDSSGPLFGTKTFYTTDGSTPTHTGGIPTGSTILGASGTVTISVTTTIKAIYYNPAYVDSDVSVGLYTIGCSGGGGGGGGSATITPPITQKSILQ